MKIVFTVATYYPCKDGVQLVTGYLAEGLAKYGHEVVVITSKYDYASEETYNGVKIIRENIFTRHTINYGNQKRYEQTVLQEAKDAAVLINVCTQTVNTDWCFRLLDEISCKKILYMHGMYEMNGIARGITGLSDLAHGVWNDFRWRTYYKKNAKFIKKYDRVIQLHPFDFATCFFKKKYNIQSCIIENAAEDAFFIKDTRDNSKKYVISVANYIPRKNQEFILRAFYEADIDREVGLVLIGGTRTNYYDRLVKLNEKLKEQYGNRKVELLTKINREDTIRLVKNSLLYLLGSKWEAFPISIVESMAAGVPFISTEVGCVKYLPGGVIVKREDEMAYWMEILLKNEESRKGLGIVGETYAKKNLSMDVKVKQLLEIIECISEEKN